MKTVYILGFPVSIWLAIPLAYFLWVSLGLFLKRAGFQGVRKFTQGTKTKFDDLFLEAGDLPLTLLIFTSGGFIVDKMLPPGIDGELTTGFLIGFKATTILAVVLFADRFITGLFKEYGHQVEVLKTTGDMARWFVRIIVIGLGLLILLDSFGVSITPIIASLGIGSLAVALALQPTLENFFSGVQLVIDKPVQLGQFIKLETGQEGYVHKIGWRSSWIRMLPNNMVVIPNKVLVNSLVINYYYPDKELAVLVDLGVHYKSDLEQVERVTVEVAKETMNEVTGGIPAFQPFIRYHTFGEYTINFSVIMRAREFTDQYLIKHEFIKRLHKRYAQEGIVIPYPIQAVNYEQEQAVTARDDEGESRRR